MVYAHTTLASLGPVTTCGGSAQISSYGAQLTQLGQHGFLPLYETLEAGMVVFHGSLG